MDDLISRQAAITALSHMCSEDEKGITVSRANVDSMLKSLPPAQPEERTEKRTETRACDLIRRKTGVWLAYTSVPGYMFCKCAACGADILVPYTGRNKPIFNYCPNCGAKMKGEMI